MKYAVYVVVIEDTNESVEALSNLCSSIEEVESNIGNEEIAINIAFETANEQ